MATAWLQSFFKSSFDFFKRTGTSSCSSDGQSNFSKCLNRAFLCLIAVYLLWLTSLKCVYLIVERFIAFPSYDSIYNSCEFAYNDVIDQRNKFENCAITQIDSCNTIFQNDLNIELSRINNILKINADKITIITNANEILSTQLTSLKQSLYYYHIKTIYNEIPYNLNCSTSNLLQVKDFIDDQSISPLNTVSSSSTYVDNNNNLLQHIITYTESLTNYNEEYIINKLSTLDTLSIQSINRISNKYSLNIQNTIQSMTNTMDIYKACISLDETNTKKCTGISRSMLTQYNEYKTTLDTLMTAYSNSFTTAKQELSDYVTRVKVAVTNANMFYDAIMGSAGVVYYVVNTVGVKKSVLCSYGGVNWCDMSSSAFTVSNPTDLNFPPLYSLPSASDLWKTLKKAQTLAYQNLSSITTSINTDVSDWSQSLVNGVESLPFAPNDYDPPIYTTYYTPTTSSSDASSTDPLQYDVDQQLKASEEYISNLSTSISELISSIYSEQTISIENISVSNITMPSYVTFNFQSLFSTDWKGLTAPHITYMDFVNYAASLSQYLFLLDVIFRLFETYRIVVSYWNKSAIDFPIPDITVSSTSVLDNVLHSVLRCRSRTATELLSSTLSLAWMYVIAVCIVLAYFIFALSATYMPFLNTYKNACVHHTINDTFLSSNLGSLAFDYSTSSGSSYANVHLKKYETNFVSTCNTQLSTTNAQYVSDKSTLDTEYSNYKDIIDLLEVLSSCIDIDSLDGMFSAACCGYEGYDACSSFSTSQYECPINAITGKPYNSPGNILNASSAYINPSLYSTIESNVFNCDALPDCTITCDGVAKEVLRASYKDCACMSEWLLHATILCNFILGAIYVLINISRILFCKGLTSLHWRLLLTNEFKYVASCKRSGTLLFNTTKSIQSDSNKLDRNCNNDGENEAGELDEIYEDVEMMTLHPPYANRFERKSTTENNNTHNKELKMYFDNYIWRYELVNGYGYLILPILLCIPWIFFLCFVSSNISYAR